MFLTVSGYGTCLSFIGFAALGPLDPPGLQLPTSHVCACIVYYTTLQQANQCSVWNELISLNTMKPEARVLTM